MGFSLAVAFILKLDNPYWIPISCLAVMQGNSTKHIGLKRNTTYFRNFCRIGYYMVNCFWKSIGFIYCNDHYFFTGNCRIFSRKKLRIGRCVYHHTYDIFSRIRRRAFTKYQPDFHCPISGYYYWQYYRDHRGMGFISWKITFSDDYAFEKIKNDYERLS